MIDFLQIVVFTYRAVFVTGIVGGSLKVGGVMAASVLTFNQDILDKKENGLMFCYHCDHQIDPKSRATLFKALDGDQSLAAFNCETCRKDNYFPIAPNQKDRAIHGGKIYGELKQKLFRQTSSSTDNGSQNTILNKN